MASPMSLESRDSQDSEVAKSGQFRLSLKRVSTGDSGSSRTSGVGATESEPMTSNDSPVKVRVSGRKRKSRILDEAEDSEVTLAARADDGQKVEDVGVKERVEVKDRSEPSQQLTGSCVCRCLFVVCWVVVCFLYKV